MNAAVELVQAQVVPAVAHRRVADYVALTKPGITIMVTLTAGLGFYIASPERVVWDVLLHLLAGTALSAAGAAALNMFLEREADGKMDRTKDRPLPAGRLAPVEAMVLGTLLCAGGVVYLAVAANVLAAGLAAATIVGYLGLYTPLKRRTSLATVVGAVPGAIPPVIGWAAAGGRLEGGAVPLFLILFFWQLPHFLALAWMYREDYARARMPMLAVSDADGSVTGRQVVLQTLALLVASLLPMGFGAAGEAYLVAALFLGAGFLGFGVAFAAERTRERAQRLFLASIAYLPLLLAALALL